MMNLNSEQELAATSNSKYISVVAGPGTGKTHTVASRALYLIRGKHHDPASIVVLTFTKKAAQELQGRIHESLHFSTPLITTFHGLAYKLLTEKGREINLIQSDEIDSFIDEIHTEFSRREIVYALSMYKNTKNCLLEGIEKIFEQYVDFQKRINKFDYDDLLIELLQEDFSGRFKTIIVDEFQDTNELQLKIINKLAGNTASVFVVGDPNQSIYGFRGASSTLFSQFYDSYPTTQKITLKNTYRSGKRIVAVGNALIANTTNLLPQRNDEGTVRLLVMNNEISEAEFIADEICNRIGGVDLLSAAKIQKNEVVAEPKDIAVLYRTHGVARKLSDALKKRGIPFQIAGNKSFFANNEVKKMVHEMKKSDTTIKVSDWIDEYVKKHPQLKPSIYNALLMQLKQFDCATHGVKAACAYIDEIVENDYVDPNLNVVSLLSAHAAKGLEFPVVYILGCEEGLFPHSKCNHSIDEENRLFYVAATRAKNELTFLWSKNRRGKSRKKSPFLETTTNILVESEDPEAQKRKLRTLKKNQIQLF